MVTPNLPEARVLAGRRRRRPTRAELARAVHALGPAAVVVTGGHREQAVDVFFDGERLVEIPGERYPDGAAHGSGCTHSSALAARLALGDDPLEAARAAKAAGRRGRRDGLRELGAGPARSTCSALRRRAVATRRRPAPAEPVLRFDIILPVRFLRMKPGHGEVLIAEGDVELAEDEQRLIEEFRRQLDAGMWAAVPTHEPTAGAARRSMVRRSTTSRGTPTA